jgi:zinc transporter ZupT
MFIAAVLFVVGVLIGWSYTMLVMVATSILIMVGALILFAFGPGLDLLHLLIVLGYLTAHQAGYLLGITKASAIGTRRYHSQIGPSARL